MPLLVLLACFKSKNNNSEMNKKRKNQQMRSYDCDRERQSKSQHPTRIRSNKRVRFCESPVEIPPYAPSHIHRSSKTFSVQCVDSTKEKLINNMDKYYSCEEN